MESRPADVAGKRCRPEACATSEDIRDWQGYVSSHPKATLYHDHSWRRFVESVYGIHTKYLMCREGDRVIGVLPISLAPGLFRGKKAVALPYHMYGGLLADNDAAVGALLEEARAVIRNAGSAFLEMRHLEPISGHGLTDSTHKLTMVLDLPSDPEELWESFPAKVRNQVRKAEKSDLKVEVDREDGLKLFYEIMLINMRDLGSPIHSFEYFRKAVEISGDKAGIWTVHLGDKCLAAGITLGFRDRVELPWASSLREYNSLCPNNLLYWAVIKNACETGYKIFDFGRCTRDSGTHKFKKQWQGREVQLYYQYLPADPSAKPPTEGLGKAMLLAAKIWERLPLGLTKLLGPMLVKRIP